MEAATISRLEGELRAQCEHFDPDSVALPEVVGIFRDLDRIDRLAAGAKLRLLRLLDDAGIARQHGHRSTADWVAAQTGTTVGAARGALDTSKRLRDQAATDRALANGELSGEQANAVSDAAAADPDAERELIRTAKRRSVRDLKKRCADTKANAHPDPAAKRETIRRGRYLRTFRDDEGGWNLSMRHLPEVGAEIESLLAPYTQAAFDSARTRGEHHPHEAYRADGLLAMARASRSTGSTVPKGASRADTKVFVHIDLDTLLAGRTTPGSICRIDGIGPVDVAWVRSILGEAFVAALLHDAVGVRSVIHLGRQVTAHQRTAMEARGYHCEVPGCSATHNLEIDHIAEWALTRRTTLDELMWICGHHHHQKTHLGYTIGGHLGNRTWTAPGGTNTHDQAARAPDPPAAPTSTPGRQAGDGDGDGDGRRRRTYPLRRSLRGLNAADRRSPPDCTSRFGGPDPSPLAGPVGTPWSSAGHASGPTVGSTTSERLVLDDRSEVAVRAPRRWSRQPDCHLAATRSTSASNRGDRDRVRIHRRRMLLEAGPNGHPRRPLQAARSVRS